MLRLSKGAALSTVVAALVVACALPQPSAAQTPGTEQAQSAVTTELKYALEVRVDGNESAVSAAIKANSLLAQNQQAGAADIASLVARARADEKRLVAVLYNEARYGGVIQISIAGRSLDQVDLSPATTEQGAVTEVVIAVSPGDEFRFGNVVLDSTTRTGTEPLLTPRDYGLVEGEPARSSIIVAALGKIVEQWRAAGYPFASIGEKEIAADHERKRIDAKIVVNPGAPAVYGWISVAGSKQLSNETVARQSALTPGTRYDPAHLEKTRERLRKLESIESVRIIEGKSVDDSGGIPITLEVKERKRRYIGATASITTLDGAEIKSHWGHRNLFGEGETLRVEGSVARLGSAPLDELEFDATATLTKPGILDIDTNLFMQFQVEREANDVYLSDSALAKIGINRRYSPHLTASIALEGRYIRSEDEFGTADYALISLPGDVSYDTRDNRFDPKSGVRTDVRLAPVTDVRTGDAFVVSEFDAASYWSADEEGRMIFAARLRGGSNLGGSLQDTPATYRFLAGGGNSVRGYEYRSLGPTVGGRVVGGLSYAGASFELRLRPTQQIGLVPFIDVATVSVDSLPSFTETIYVGAGLGLRYFTPIGPIRLDLAVPLTDRRDRPKFGVYVGLGQAF